MGDVKPFKEYGTSFVDAILNALYLIISSDKFEDLKSNISKVETAVESLDEDTTDRVKTSILTSPKVFAKNLTRMVARIVNLEDNILGLGRGARHAARNATACVLHSLRP